MAAKMDFLAIEHQNKCSITLKTSWGQAPGGRPGRRDFAKGISRHLDFEKFHTNVGKILVTDGPLSSRFRKMVKNTIFGPETGKNMRLNNTNIK